MDNKMKEKIDFLKKIVISLIFPLSSYVVLEFVNRRYFGWATYPGDPKNDAIGVFAGVCFIIFISISIGLNRKTIFSKNTKWFFIFGILLWIFGLSILLVINRGNFFVLAFNTISFVLIFLGLKDIDLRKWK